MSTTYQSLFQLTPEGLQVFERVMTRQLSEEALDLSNRRYATPVEGTTAFTGGEFTTAKEMAVAICASFEKNSPQNFVGNIGLWAWLTFVLLDNLFPITNGARKILEYHRWYPSAPNHWQKAQRHLVRMPTLLYAAFGNDADHLICGKPRTGPDIREQLTSQQDMFSSNFQRVARVLYFSDENGTVKRGAGLTKGPGIPRRLAAVRKQLDVTWDMTDLTTERILELLPPEFDQYKTEAA
ncbi:hypothetical protein [Mesorhizobium loti]|uniref:Uncharacterized protein n=1 Tax=Mesorhizobium loti R88b TaxID=935548 RepID=A0A6M7WFB4_RHILI|nr:hypothetical protein [Mesorhizobium loti]QKD00546.1 hypothetical protein EB235_02875 [Mesorhizobium loti R88b]